MSRVSGRGVQGRAGLKAVWAATWSDRDLGGSGSDAGGGQRWWDLRKF